MDKIAVAKELVKIARQMVTAKEESDVDEWCEKLSDSFFNKFPNDDYFEITPSDGKYDAECTFAFGIGNARQLASAKRKWEKMIQFIEKAINEFKKRFPNETLVW